MNSPNEVLAFWFGSCNGADLKDDVSFIESRMPLWFGRTSSAFEDAQVQQRGMVEQLASSPDLPHQWTTSSGRLALIILFDQIPRCIYRGTSGAFQFDHLAVESAQALLQCSTDGDPHSSPFFTDFVAIQRLFIILSLQHMEDLDLQTKAIHLADEIAWGESDEMKEYFRRLPGFPHEHYEVIRRFGRFPSRNGALVRTL